MSQFNLISDFKPRGDQPEAINQLVERIKNNTDHQVLLGVTGSGKTYTVANVIERLNRPALVMAPNKTLAAQLYHEFKEFFPQNAVEYFVSYYDYYQPEAYIPASDTYIQKDSSINEMIDKMRHSATRSVLSRRDVIVVASVSCIYGIGAPEDYLGLRVNMATGQDYPRDKMLADLINIQYDRNDMDFHRGVFRVRGDRVEIFPAYEENVAIRVEYFGDEIEQIAEIDPLKGDVNNILDTISIFPASHYVTKRQTLEKAVKSIAEELKHRVNYFRDQTQWIEAQRIEERTNYDLEMMMEIGYCNGIENYSRHLTGRTEGEPPPTLLDYFPEDFLLFMDESHIAVPQVRGMYAGDRSRKSTLVKFGFRLPSALDNRPLRFDEFFERSHQTIYVSATPADYEIDISEGKVVEQIVRPTGLIDPEIEVRSALHQVDDLYSEINVCLKRKERVLVTTLTKRMAEDLTEYYSDLGIRVRYLHSEVKTLERMEIIKELRQGEFDVLIGINLLREGLDIPEVSLVAILDADKEGFLRSQRSLIQIFGRAARNVNGKVVLYAEKMTMAMQNAIDETQRRRKIQKEHNQTNNITPQTIRKSIHTLFDKVVKNSSKDALKVQESQSAYSEIEDMGALIQKLEKEMQEAAGNLEFEKAAKIRDRIKEMKEIQMFF